MRTCFHWTELIETTFDAPSSSASGHKYYRCIYIYAKLGDELNWSTIFLPFFYAVIAFLRGSRDLVRPSQENYAFSTFAVVVTGLNIDCPYLGWITFSLENCHTFSTEDRSLHQQKLCLRYVTL